MTSICFRQFAIVATLAASSLLAHADTFNFAVSRSAGGVSGSGIFTASETGSGDFLITGNVFSDGTDYFAFFRDEDAFADTLPIFSFELGPTTAPIPEPPTLLLIGTGLLGVAGVIRKGSRIRLRDAIYRRLRKGLGRPSLFPQKKSEIPRANL